MEFKYNNSSYWIHDNDSLSKILSRNDLLSFPLNVWKELLIQKFGIFSKEVLLKILKIKIENYDTSSEVNGFYINGIDFWLDKNTRVGLAHLANCTEGIMQLMLGDIILEIESSVVKDILAQIERYAAQCYLQTQKHLIAIKELKTVEDMINYDYTKGYPEKLTFTV